MKNKLSDLNNHLFMQLERLGDEDMTAEQLEREIKRTDAIAQVSEQIVKTANTGIKAAALMAEYGRDGYEAALPEMDKERVAAIEHKKKDGGYNGETY